MGMFKTLFTASLCVLRVVALPSSDSTRRSDTAPVAEVITDDALFSFESIQLTDDALSILDAKTAALFDFDTVTPETTERKRAVQCKTYPGDALWPGELIWSTFNWALGKDALIKTVPLASSCYNGWKYDAAKCATLVSSWTNSHIQ